MFPILNIFSDANQTNSACHCISLSVYGGGGGDGSMLCDKYTFMASFT